MPKKKIGQRKKNEKQRLRQTDIRTAFYQKPLAEHPCNAAMDLKNDVLSLCDADKSEIASGLSTSNSDSNIVKETPARSTHAIHDDVEWDAAWSLLRLADFAPSETTALPKKTSIGDRSSASLKESHSNVNTFSHVSLLTMANKTPVATPVRSAVSRPINNSENTAQTARVFSTRNIHVIGGIFASPHTMQVITQPSGIKLFTTPNSIVASNSSVQPFSVNSHQHGQIHVLAPTSNTSYASSIISPSKKFCSDSLVKVTSSTTNSISKPHHVSPLALVSPQTMVGVSHSRAGKSLNNNAAIADMIIPQGSSGILNLSQSPVKGNSVLSGNMTIAVKNNLSTNSIATCASHSNKISTLHVSKACSQVIQPSLASSTITQGEVASPSSAKASTSNEPQRRTVEKKEVKFSIASIYYFNRTQGFTSVPSQGGCSLGMEKNHTHMEILSVENYGKKNIINSQRKKPSPVLLSDGNEDSTEESNDLPVCELEVTCETFKPLTVDKRRALLRASGVQTIDASEKRECDFIRSSRQNCGCECKTTCDPDTCSCSNLGIKCQVEVFSFPCGCSHDSCGNPNGRYEYGGNKVQNHLKKL